MAKLTDFTTPTGAKGNLFDISSWTQLIIGTFVLLATFAIGQNLAKKVSQAVPAVDTSISPIVDMPKTATVSNAVVKEVF